MSLFFRELECIDVSDVKKEVEADAEHVLLKLKAAFNLCWELPQIVLDRLFSAKQCQLEESDNVRLTNALANNIEELRFPRCQPTLSCNKYLAFPRFRSNACLKILTAFSEEMKLFLALFATEARPVNAEHTLDKELPPCELPFAYAIVLSPDSTKVTFYISSYDTNDPGSAISAAFGLTPGWFQFGLVRKICSWMTNPEFEVAPSNQPRSMRLVDPELYLSTYLALKGSIGSYWVKNWPERTDPQKFVYEELAIAAYLLTIWHQIYGANSAKVTFADLGCGNGFLTYALNNSNLTDISASGIGVDARKRKIWDVYPGMERNLIEAPVSAENLSQFSGTEWFIGNHSDELTPWIPYIASKCGPDAKVFLLPCCPFDFHEKYKFRKGGKSLYGGYLDYIERLCSLCGFEVQRDRLRIPSTKRVCFVCTKRADVSAEVAEQNRNELESLLQKSSRQDKSASADPLLPKAPEVRNCTAIAADLKQSILQELFDLLLNRCSEDKAVIKLNDGHEWHAGGRLPLNEAILLLSARSIAALKDQDGGLKTFCKNYSFVFTVVDGCVYFRPHPTAAAFLASRRKKPRAQSSANGPDDAATKKLPAAALSSQKQCWFELHHPDGCPYLPDGECRCRHHKAAAASNSQSFGTNDGQ